MHADPAPFLVIGHPGHELPVYGWLRQSSPYVTIITDGSGRTGMPRIAASLEIIAAAGARTSDVFGQLSDAALYRALLTRDCALFIAMAQRLADSLAREDCPYVVGDASEGYNPTHDVCRLLINAAVTIAGRRVRRRIGNFQFSLVGDPRRLYAASCRDQAMVIKLDDTTWASKVSAVRRYGTRASGAFLREVENFIGDRSADVLRTEYLVPVTDDGNEPLLASARPYYETLGAQRVAAGHYRHVIRHDEHILPLARALQRLADHGS